jgi:hypothetical protein
MKTNLIIVDDFHPDPAALRARVLASRFGDQTGPDGAKYTGISLHQDTQPPLADLISCALGVRVIPRMAFYRLNLDKEMPHSFVHSDDICARYASILYLNEPEQCRGGTAFWKHAETGLDAMPTAEQARAMGRDPKEVELELGADWKILEKWKLCGFVGMKFNRFVSYPTSMFHSRYPHEGFGAGKDDGRLIYVCFYDLDTGHIRG